MDARTASEAEAGVLGRLVARRGGRLGLMSAALGIASAAVACSHAGGTGAGGTGAGATSTTAVSTGAGGGASASGATTSSSAASSSGNGWCAGRGNGGSCGSSSSGGGATGGLVLTVDLCAGPARQYDPPATPQPVSEYIYGINAGDFVATSTKWGLIRQGGDDDTDYNWTVDYTNSGADYCYFQGGATKDGNLAGRYTDPTGDTIAAALAKGEAFLATVPILDFVAAKYDRNTGWDTAANAGDACPGPDAACSNRSGSLRANVVDKAQGDPNFGETLTFAFAAGGSSTPTGSPAFVKNTMSKGSAFCSCPAGTKTCAGCSVAASPVAQDELVNFLKVNYASGGAPVFFDLDNEPNYWIGTHPEIYPNDCSSGSVPWDDVVDRNVAAATAVKNAWPAAKVFGPVVSGEGMSNGGDSSSPYFVAGKTEFSDHYLQKLAAASVAAGEPLIDALDVHYYTVGNSDAECLESPRLFWDPDATDISADETNSLDFDYGDHSYWDQYWYPRQVIPRLQKKVAAAYAGAKTAPPPLSFSEYNPGCETAISGGVAQADLLGIFGREGVFAASAWPLEAASGSYLVAAYDLYRNYDGQGSMVGDTTVRATTSDAKNTSVYAFTHTDDAKAVEVVAINKLSTPQAVTIQIASAPALHTAKLYDLVGGSPAVAAAAGAAPAVTCACGACTVTFTMPATSATTVVLR